MMTAGSFIFLLCISSALATVPDSALVATKATPETVVAPPTPPQITLTMADGTAKTVDLKPRTSKGGGHAIGVVPLDDDAHDTTGSVVKWSSTHPIKNVWGKRMKNRPGFLVGGDLGEGFGHPTGFFGVCTAGDGRSCSLYGLWPGKCASNHICCWFPGAIFMETYAASDHDCSGATTGHCSAASASEVQEWTTIGGYGPPIWSVEGQVRISNNQVEARILYVSNGIDLGLLVPPTNLGPPGQCMSTCGYYCPKMRDNMDPATHAALHLKVMFGGHCPDCIP